MEKIRNFFKDTWKIFFIVIAFGIILAIQSKQIEENSFRLGQMEKKLDEINFQLQNFNSENKKSVEVPKTFDELKIFSCTVPLEGEGIIIKMDDSAKPTVSNENQNLYVIHDDDILRVINELRAAGAEAISINGQRLTATSEIRCAGPTLSVNNVRSASPFEISAIGDKKNLENAIKMRGGVAETLKVWGIKLEINVSDKIYIPPYTGATNYVYAKIAEEKK